MCFCAFPCGTHLPIFWIFSISRSHSHLETARLLTPNCSACCFFQLFCVFPCSSCAISKSLLWKAETIVHMYLEKEHVRHKLLEVIGMIRWQFSSNVNKKLMPSANLLCSVINSDILNATTQHYPHTFPIHHSCTSDTCWWQNKMAQCQIFTAQTALVRHLLSEICISYMYTWYIVRVNITF